MSLEILYEINEVKIRLGSTITQLLETRVKLPKDRNLADNCMAPGKNTHEFTDNLS
jgi:hypothetical protein